MEIGNLAENHKAAASHATDFDVTSVEGLLPEIRKCRIPIIPGLFTDDMPEENGAKP
jgi:hypothetical protein